MGLQSVSNLLPVPHPELVTSLEPHQSHWWQRRQGIDVLMSLVECCRCYSLQCCVKFLIRRTVQCVLCCSADREVALPLHWSYTTQSARQEHKLCSLFFPALCCDWHVLIPGIDFFGDSLREPQKNRQLDKLPFLHLQRSVHLANKTPRRWWGCCLVILPTQKAESLKPSVGVFPSFLLACFVLYFSEKVFFMKISQYPLSWWLRKQRRLSWSFKLLTSGCWCCEEVDLI